MTTKHLALGLLTHPTSNHVASWMHPGAQIDAGTNFKHYVELAKPVPREGQVTRAREANSPETVGRELCGEPEG